MALSEILPFAFAKALTSPSAVRVTLRVPVLVVGQMVTLAVAWVASVVVSELTVMPAPKLAAVVSDYEVGESTDNGPPPPLAGRCSG
jgi:hypothetical protein